MGLNEKIEEVLRKKAFGFSYIEETIECETTKPKPMVYCERENALYFKNGFISVKKQTKNGEIVALCHKNIQNITTNKDIINGLKAFNLKRF